VTTTYSEFYRDYSPVEGNDYLEEDNQKVAVESFLSPLADAKVGIFDFSILMIMWALCLICSVKNFGRAGGGIFFLLGLLLVLRRPSNCILLFLLLFFVPNDTLQLPIGPFRIVAAMGLAGYVIHGKWANLSGVFNKVFIWAAILVFYLPVTVILASNRDIALSYYLKYVEGLIALFLVFALIDSREQLGRALKWWVIVSALSLIVSLVHYGWGPNTFLGEIHLDPFAFQLLPNITTQVVIEGETISRIMWLGKDPNGHSTNLIFALGVSLALYSASQYRYKILWMIMALMIGAGILGTYSRTGLIVTFIVVSYFLLQRNIRAIFPLIFIVLGILAALIYIPALPLRIFSIESAWEAGASSRFPLWVESIKMWLKSPVIGMGLRAFSEEHYFVVHNSYLQILAEAGIIGAVLYGGIIVVVAKAMRRLKDMFLDKNAKDIVFAKAVMIGFWGMCLHIGAITYQDVKLFWMECGVCGLMYYLTRKEFYEQEAF